MRACLLAIQASESSQYLKVGPELSTPAYDRHVVDTIKRLQCIKQVSPCDQYLGEYSHYFSNDFVAEQQ